MASQWNEILDPTTLERLYWVATVVDENASLRDADGGVPVKIPVVINLRMYNGTISGVSGYDTTFNWPETCKSTYVGVPEQYREYYQQLRAKLLGIPVGYGATWETWTLRDEHTPNPNPGYWLNWDSYIYDFEERIVDGGSAPYPIMPAPTSWHGFWPQGYDYRTFPELQAAMDDLDFAIEKTHGSGGDFKAKRSHNWNWYWVEAKDWSMSDYKELRFSQTVTNPGASPMPATFSCRVSLPPQATILPDGHFNTVFREAWFTVFWAGAGTTREDPGIPYTGYGDGYDANIPSGLRDNVDISYSHSVTIPPYGSLSMQFHLYAKSYAIAYLGSGYTQTAAEQIMDHANITLEVTTPVGGVVR